MRGVGGWLVGRRRSLVGMALLLALGVVLFLPAIRAPLFLDDYMQASMVRGTFPLPRFGAFDLYDFVNDGDRALLYDRGVLPWWTEPTLQIRFLRPLSSALLWADHRLFEGSALPLHIHSLLWWAATVLLARVLYRRLMTVRVARMATIIFALAPCHTFPIAWLANREALVSITFGIPALDAYVRWRQGGRWTHAAFATGLFALSMAGGEYALCFGGYVLAYELVTRGEGLGTRAVRLLPFAAPALAYLVVRAALGYGAHGSGYYADPFLQPMQFVHAVPRRAAVLTSEAWGGLHGLVFDDETSPWVLAVVVVVGVAILAWPLRRMLLQLDAERRRTVGWLLLGAHLALIPVLPAAPAPRLLGATMLGLAPAIAVLLDQAWFPEVLPARRGAAELTGLVALGLGFAHFVHGPATAWLMSREFLESAAGAARRTAELQARQPEVASSEVFVIRGLFNSFILPFSVDAKGRTFEGRWRVLSQTGHVLALRRNAHTLDLVVPSDTCLFPKGVANLFRADSSTVPVGAKFELPGVHVTVLDVGPRGPRSARFAFDTDLESPGRVWINDAFEGLEDVELPPPGFGKPFDP